MATHTVAAPFRIGWWMVLLSLCVAAPVAATGFSVGSARISNACWTAQQREGSAADSKIRYNKRRPDHSPPQQQAPKAQLAPLPERLRGSIRSVRLADPTHKRVALTFDLCEKSTETTGFDTGIVHQLRQMGIKATFYAGGKWMRSHPEQTQQLMADPLFEIGNHAWTHGNLRLLKGAALEAQVVWTQAEYERLRQDLAQRLPQCGLSAREAKAEMAKIPPLPLTFRYPYGTCSREALDFVASQGLPSVQWSIVTADSWNKEPAERIRQILLQEIKPGAIIIAHANGRGWHTAEALRLVLPELLAQGYEFVTVSELLAAGEPKAASSCYELRPGDNGRYDQLVGEGTE